MSYKYLQLNLFLPNLQCNTYTELVSTDMYPSSLYTINTDWKWHFF